MRSLAWVLVVCGVVVLVVYLALSSAMTGANKILNDGSQAQRIKDPLQSIQDRVAQDMVKQYVIAAHSGSAMDRCSQAGFVVAGFLQAKDEENYKTWKAIQRRDCIAAGMPSSLYTR